MRPYWLPLLLLSTFIPAQAYTLQGPQYAEDPVKVAQRERAEQAKQQELQRQQELKLQQEANRLPSYLILDPKQEAAELKDLISGNYEALLVYGGNQYANFLGCLNCAPHMHISLWNSKGPYGSPLSPRSIWSDFFEFGNAKSNLSPWNPYAAKPPVIVDPQGKFYGYFTANQNLEQVFANNFSHNLVTMHRDIKRNPELWFSLAFKAFLPEEGTSSAHAIALSTLERMPRAPETTPEPTRPAELVPQAEPTPVH